MPVLNSRNSLQYSASGPWKCFYVWIRCALEGKYTNYPFQYTLFFLRVTAERERQRDAWECDCLLRTSLACKLLDMWVETNIDEEGCSASRRLAKKKILSVYKHRKPVLLLQPGRYEWDLSWLTAYKSCHDTALISTPQSVMQIVGRTNWSLYSERYSGRLCQQIESTIKLFDPSPLSLNAIWFASLYLRTREKFVWTEVYLGLKLLIHRAGLTNDEEGIAGRTQEAFPLAGTLLFSGMSQECYANFFMG
jgi:hypothetical protein